ncbi:MAG: Rad52/Rad22 family DNA repair protein [Pseudomonadota bacterium]
MALTDTQTKSLKAKLNHRFVKTRENQGSTLSYIEGWHAIAEANRIFGFDSWDRQTLDPRCVWSDLRRGQTVCFYSTKVRITVRAGDTVTVREGIGTGLGRAQAPETAHELALKVSETDATKRALATFGNPFGLALYDSTQRQVTKPSNRTEPKRRMVSPTCSLKLALEDDSVVEFEQDEDFIKETIAALSRLPSIEDVYNFWSSNLDAFTDLRRRTEGRSDPVASLIETFKLRLREIGLQHRHELREEPIEVGSRQTSAEPARLLLPKEKRIRDREHLKFVAKQPCLICGRRPAQAHHLRFAQPRAMALKVSDEFTVPLCNTHHDSLHRTGDERAWWAQNGIIEPLKYADRLWAASRLRRSGDDTHDAALESDAGSQSAAPQPSTEPASSVVPSTSANGASHAAKT